MAEPTNGDGGCQAAGTRWIGDQSIRRHADGRNERGGATTESNREVVRPELRTRAATLIARAAPGPYLWAPARDLLGL